MRRIVLPFTALIDTVPALNVINAITPADIRVAIEIVVHVDVDVVASPAGVPAPSAASPGGANCNANSK
jgi:hypothetical protein